MVPDSGIDLVVIAAASIPALVTAFALFSLRKAVQALAYTHVAETVFRASTPEEAADRARTMGTLFRRALPQR